MRKSPILMYQFAIDIHVNSTSGASAACTDGASANAIAARPPAMLDLIFMMRSSVKPTAASLHRSRHIGAQRRRHFFERLALGINAEPDDHGDGDQHQHRGR